MATPQVTVVVTQAPIQVVLNPRAAPAASGGGGGKAYLVQTSSASVVSVAAATTYLRLTGDGQLANLPALATMNEGDILRVKACFALSTPHTLQAAGSDKIFDTDNTLNALTMNNYGGSVTLIAQVSIGAWETVQ